MGGIQNAARQRAIVALHGASESWLKILFAYKMISWIGPTSTAVMIGSFTAVGIVMISQIIFMKKMFNNKKNVESQAKIQEWISEMWQFSWPFSAWGIFTWAHQVSDRWGLEKFSNTAAVGQYTVLYQIGYQPVVFLTGTVVSLFVPILYQRVGSSLNGSRVIGTKSFLWKVSVVFAILTLVIFCFTSVYHAKIFFWFVSDHFEETSYLLPWLALAGGAFSTGQALVIQLMAEIRLESLTVVKISTALFGIFTNILGVWLFGIQGLVASQLIFAFLYLLMVLAISKKFKMQFNVV
jgi:O-antigen/teichoic acid export membrane protein